MQCCSFGWMGERITNRASSASKAPALAAFPARFAPDPGTAAVDVVGSAGECVDRTGAEAWAGSAPFAGSLTCRPSGKRDSLPKANGTPAGIPEAEICMHEHAERGRPNRVRTLGPCQEWPVRRTIAGKKGNTADGFSSRPDDPLAPAVERIRSAVFALRRLAEFVPGFRMRGGRKDQCADGSGRGAPRLDSQPACPEPVRRQQPADVLKPIAQRIRLRNGR